MTARTQPSLALITGGTGFVAGHLAQRLLREGYAVRATYRGKPDAALDSRVEWTRIEDLGPDTEWAHALADVDVIFHLAGLAHQLDKSRAPLPEDYDRINAHATKRLAQCVVQHRPNARIVLLGSIGAVCTVSKEPVRIDTPERPDSVYGRSKLLAEKLLKETCAGTDVSWCIVRAPLVYGPNAPGNIQRLIRLVDRGWPLPLRWALAKRSFVFVENLVDALVRCGESPRAANQMFLVADPQDVSVAELVSLIAELKGRRLMLVPVPPGLLHVAARLADRALGTANSNARFGKAVELLFSGLQLDTTHIRTTLDWNAPYALREGLAVTLRAEESARR